MMIPAGAGVAQVIFYRLEEPTEQPYEGKYQDQGANQGPLFEQQLR
jgi:deoxycytidine triphosphate deaminase